MLARASSLVWIQSRTTSRRAIPHASFVSSNPLVFSINNQDDREQNDLNNRKRYQQVVSRQLHSTVKSQSIVLTCIGIGGAAFAGSLVLDSIAKRRAEQAAAGAQQQEQEAQAKPEAGAAAGGGNPFSSLFSGFLGAKTFYQGGFEPQMTKREAALILGVRESAPREKIREAHRNMSRANHPDTGGSEFLAMKINEAKDLLLGSK